MLFKDANICLSYMKSVMEERMTETLEQWARRRNPKHTEQNSPLYYLFQKEWGWIRASEFRDQRLATWNVAQVTAVEEFHRLSHETRKFICMQNNCIGHNYIDSLLSTLR
jgi:hypothetical protein